MLFVCGAWGFEGMGPSKLFCASSGSLNVRTSVFNGIFGSVATTEVGPLKDFEDNGDSSVNKCQLTILVFGYLTGLTICLGGIPLLHNIHQLSPKALVMLIITAAELSN